jgi:uncharacterized protein YgiM (DUF1202 family)
MKRKTLLITILIITITSVLLIVSNFSFAASQGEITASSVNFRSQANSSSDVIGSLSKGATVTIDGEEGNFYKITYNSKQGYVSKQFVKTTDSSNQNESDNKSTSATNTATSATTSSTESLTEEEAIKKNEVTVNSDTTIYVLPLLNSTKVGNFTKNGKVTLVSINGKWAYVRGSSKSGWIDKEVLSSQTVYLPQGTEETSGVESNSSNENTATNETNSSTNSDKSVDNSSKKTMYVNTDAVNIRKEASTTSTIINSAEKNTAITVTGTSGDWSKVKTSSGAEGYILSKYLSANKS